MFFRPSAGNRSIPTGQIFMKIYIRVFFEYLSRKFRHHSNPTRITTLYTKSNIRFYRIYYDQLLEEEIFQITVVEKIKTKILVSISFLDNRAVYEIMLKNILEQCRPRTAMTHAPCTLDT
jgi:hypothetical protein